MDTITITNENAESLEIRVASADGGWIREWDVEDDAGDVTSFRSRADLLAYVGEVLGAEAREDAARQISEATIGTEPIRMTYGFVLSLPRRHYRRFAITPAELAAWANDTDDGRQVFTGGLTEDQAAYLLAKDPDELVPADEQEHTSSR